MAAPRRCLVASVAGAGATVAVRQVASLLWGLGVEEARTQEFQCGVRNAYADFSQLGVDRWLAMLAAWNRFRRAVCVLDLGSAATVDVISAHGRHLGGLIAPGLTMARSLLLDETSGIRSAGDHPAAGLGTSTGDCVANGCLLGIVGLVRSALALMERECGPGGVLVAGGGDAPRVLPHLGVPYEHVPTLVFDGLLCAGGCL